MASSLVGTVLDDKFQIERPLASGASGDVYEAIHLGLGSRVAVKVLRPGLPQTAHIRRKRFEREARVAASIQSDHVVRVFDIVARDRGPIYIVMELLDGETLAARIARVGAMPPLEAVGYVLQAAKPLAAMHDAGIVHRDVKPSNIFLARDAEGKERVKLLDFGVASLQEAVKRGVSAITFTDALVGTPRYMAPEQVTSSKDVDARADVWALGVTLYEMLAGRQPFDGQTVLAVLSQIEKQEPPPLAALKPGVPAALAKLVHLCLAKDPARRPADARALGEALGPLGGETFRGEAAPRDVGDPLDLSLSDENVQVVREVAQPANGGGIAALVARKHVVAGAAAVLALGIVGLAASHRSSGGQAEVPSTVLAATPTAPSTPTSTSTSISTPTPTPTSISTPALTATVTMTPAPPSRPAHRLTKSPAHSSAAKVPGSRPTPDDDDRIE